MTQFYSKSTNGFYVSGIHIAIPDDAVKITEAERQTALDGQREGGTIQGDANGKPAAIMPAPPTPTALSTAARFKRDTLLSQSDWTQVADAPVDQAAWATYRQVLRDVTTQVGFPETIDWPAVP